MENHAVWALAFTAASIGVAHTLSGPDHYLPLIAMAKARRWSPRRALWLTALAGTAHVGSSVAFGLIGVALGVALQHLERFESWRSSLAAWALIAFGVTYLAWGLRRALSRGVHAHVHVHTDGTTHLHVHRHRGDHLHAHERSVAIWGILMIFALGSCEPLIPILMYPASQQSLGGLALVVLIYALATIATMVGSVAAGIYGVASLRFPSLSRWAHALAGGTMTACGMAIVFLGW